MAASADIESSSLEDKSRTRISSLSCPLGIHKAVLEWKGPLLLSEYFTKMLTRDPGSFDVDCNDTPAMRKLIEKSRKTLHLDDDFFDEKSSLERPRLTSHTISPVKMFSVSAVREIMKNVLRSIDYDKRQAEADGNLCKSLADEIKLCVKNEGFPRFKIICVVSLVHGCKIQNIMIASRCLWSTDYDNFVQEIFESKSGTVVATVYALYYE